MAAHTPLWAIFPFLVYLLSIAGIPIVFGHFWESNGNKLIVAVLASIPVLVFVIARPHAGERLGHTACDYLSFMALLAALFTISGGVVLRGALVGSPFVNTAFLAAGSLLGSLVGTTGASVLLIRPMLRANAKRGYATHVVVFFIFIVSNGAGLLTPLGDPPLFLGFLRGVPFTWTFRLLPQWALVNSALLTIFAIIDRVVYARERRSPAPYRDPTVPVLAPAPGDLGPLRLEGGLNLVWLVGLVGVVFLVGSYGGRVLGDGYLRAAVQIAGTLAFAAISFKTTASQIHEANRFSWAPIIEVAVVFVGVFVTMVPALAFLSERGASLGITKPWQFFWASGALSSVLDNAPTYLTFASLASGVAGGAGAGALSPDNLGLLAAHPVGQSLLTAVSCGSVFMGAVTYMGNGPNFIVKAIAEQHHVRMPSFFGYTAWSFAILIPIFGIVSRIFF
jgi:Na+/H+ antiporter NhaD/arsenite permease-like protein